MTVGLIIEPLGSGHHLTYLTELVKGAVNLGVNVIVAVSDDANGDEIGARLRSDIVSAEIPIVRVPLSADGSAPPGAFGRLVRWYSWWRFLRRAYRAAVAINRVDFVFLPYLDTALFSIAVLGSPFDGARFGGISMAQHFHLADMGVTALRPKGAALRSWLFRRLLRTKGLHEVFVIDETLAAFIEQRYPQLAAKVRYLPDPSSPATPVPKHEARAALGLSRDAPLIVVYGSLDGRKDVAKLIAWLDGSAERRDVQLLLAGRVRDEVQRVLEGEAARRLVRDRRLTVLSRYIEDHEEALIFSAADAIWIAYDFVESMSGVLVKAVLYEKAVFYRDFGLIGRYAARFGCPVSARELSVPDLPGDVRLCSFTRGAHQLPQHSWTNACNVIFGRR